MTKKIFLMIALLLIFGCAPAKDFKYGLLQLTGVNSRYNTTMDTYPKSINQAKAMIDDYKELEKLKLDSGQEPFDIIIRYRILNLEADGLFAVNAQKYGDFGTTKNGFGCTLRPLISESAALRNGSAQKGFQSADLLKSFIEKYPENAKSAGFSEKNLIFLNATFFSIYEDAAKDSSIINGFCPENVTLGIYRQQFMKKTNLSEDYINSLDYNQAVSIWKDLRGMS